MPDHVEVGVVMQQVLAASCGLMYFAASAMTTAEPVGRPEVLDDAAHDQDVLGALQVDDDPRVGRRLRAFTVLRSVYR